MVRLIWHLPQQVTVNATSINNNFRFFFKKKDMCLGSTIQQSLPGAFHSAEDNLRIIMFHKNTKSKVEYSSLDVAIFLLAAILNAL